MNEPPEKKTTLAALLDHYQKAIVTSWAEMVQRLPDSHYGARSSQEIHQQTQRGMRAIIDSLMTGTNVALENYVAEISLLRLPHEFDIDEIIQGLLLCNEAALPFITKALASDLDAVSAAVLQLDARVRYMVGRFGELYIARVVAPAQDNVQLYEETRLHLAESESLRRVSSALLQKLSLGQILEIVCNEAQRLTGAQGSTVFLLENAETLRVAFTAGVTSPTFDRIPVAESFTGAAISKGAPVVINNPLDLTVLYLGHPAATALLTVPLRVKDVPIGALNLLNKPGGFRQADVRSMSLLADQAAIAIEHARLSREAEQVAVLQERQRLARELHDSVTQSVYSIKLYAEAAIKWLKAGNATVAAEHLRDLHETADEALRDMRLLVFELRPLLLEKEGLAAAIQARLDAVEERAGIQTEFKIEGEYELPLILSEELYHIAQEALNNVLNHAHAQRVQVYLQVTEKTVCLQVHDDGIGFVAMSEGRKGGQGLRGMRERVERIAGELTIESGPGNGTRVRVVTDR